MVEGLLIVDKPLGLTSHDVVARVRRLADTRRVGHAGTLDPLATGVLVVAVGRATRLLEYVVGQAKTYQALVRLGEITATYDGEGDVIAEYPVEVTREGVEEALTHFRGPIKQVPPMYSAIKKGGKPLYKLARQGVEVEREAREVTIHQLELLAWESPHATLKVVCSTGTYIRSLAHDLGQHLGCGAYLAGLERTAIGQFVIDDAVSLETLDQDNVTSHVKPTEQAVAHLPRLELSEENASRLANGQLLPRAADEPQADLVQVYDSVGHFVGIVVAEGNQWRPRKIFYTDT